jgi:YVTN family beta-propeller protein
MPSGAPLTYVSNEGSGDITVIDTGTDSVVATIHVGKRPRGIRVSPDGKAVYVALSAPSPLPPGLDPSTLPRANGSADGIGVIDVATQRLLWELPSGSDPEQLAVSPDGSKLYISNEDAATAAVVVIGTIPVGGCPWGVAITPDGTKLYSANGPEVKHVAVVDLATERLVATGRPQPLGCGH